MAALDRVREEVAYLKVWQGIAVVGGVSLAGWLFSAEESAPALRYGLALVGIMLLGFFSLILHREIEWRIRRMEAL